MKYIYTVEVNLISETVDIHGTVESDNLPDAYLTIKDNLSDRFGIKDKDYELFEIMLKEPENKEFTIGDVRIFNPDGEITGFSTNSTLNQKIDYLARKYNY